MKINKYIWYFVVLALVVGLIQGGFALAYSTPKTSAYHPLLDNPSIPLGLGKFRSWVWRLGQHEGCKNTGTWDNHSYSYGRYCFKLSTFEMYVKHFNLLPGYSDNELASMVSDRWIQERIIYLAIKEKYGAWRNWYTTVTKHKDVGYPPKI